MSNRISARTKKRLVKRYYNGESARAICAEYQIPRSTFYHWLDLYPDRRHTERFLIDGVSYRSLRTQNTRQAHMIDVLQQAFASLNLDRKSRYAIIDRFYGSCNLHELCEAFQIDRGTYYNHLRSKNQFHQQADRHDQLCQLIHQIFLDSHGTYGVRRVQQKLHQQNIPVSEKYVRKLMQEMGLMHDRATLRRQRYLDHREHRRNLLLQQKLSVTKLNQVWVADITMFRLRDRKFYISVYLDLYSRKVIAYNVGKQASTHLVKLGFITACQTRQYQLGASILHTDGGAQYDSWGMVKEYKKYGIIHSISRPSTPTDNPVMEAFFKTLKQELLYAGDFFHSEREFRERLDDYIGFYNTERIHSSLHGLSPDQYEQQYRDRTTKDD